MSLLSFLFRRPAALALAVVMSASLTTLAAMEAAYADPPPWAPAHGWRAKGKHKHYHSHHHHHKHKHKHKKKYKKKYKKKHYHRDVVIHHQPTYYDYGPQVGIDTGFCDRDVIGAMLGAAAGGYLGSKVGDGKKQLAAVGAGVFFGALLGGAIGRSMDQYDHNCIGHALESAPDGHPVAWQNPNGGSYQVTPQRTYQTQSGTFCREYTTHATIGGKTERLYGTSCREADGSWTLANQ